MGILKGAKGKGHLSDEGSEDTDEEMVDENTVEREFVAAPPNPVKSITAPVSTHKLPPAAFNASGSLGVVIESRDPPAASTSTHNDFDNPSARPPVAPANLPVAVGSGLKAGVVVVRKSRMGKKGVRSEMGQRMMGKGKGREVESESDGSEFDSSDDGNDESDEESKGGESDGESWKGIAEDVEASVDGDSSEEEEETTTTQRQKGSFQSWAENQVLVAAGLDAVAPTTASWNDDVYVPMLPAGSGAGFQPLPNPNGISGPLGEVLTPAQLPSLPPQRTTFVPIERTEEMQSQRKELPIVKEEDRIMEAIRGNAVIVICGETGSGKTTQIGQFLWEAGWGDASSGESTPIILEERILTFRRQIILEWSRLLSLVESRHSLRRSVYEPSSVSPPTRLWSLIESDIPRRPPPIRSSSS